VREHRPYGEQALGTPKDGPGFTGHMGDADTGLVYMQQRYYDPAIGRFLSVDPVTAYSSGDMRFFNRYAYANNNPYRFTDPDGRQACSDACMRMRATSDDGIQGTIGEARASTNGEVIQDTAKGYINSQAALGKGGQSAAHFFADDAIDGVANIVDGNYRDAAVNVAMALIGKKLGVLKAAPEKMATDMRKIMGSISGGRKAGAARDFHDVSHIADRTASELATDFIDVARSHGIPESKIPGWIRKLADE
jgi:RHS repeat-associated protein